MKLKFKLIAALLGMGLTIAIPGAVIAQNDAQNDQNQSYNTSAPAETNGVARVSLIHGDVSTQRGDSGDWSAAALNAPVLSGDRVSTGDRARTELQLDYANMLRLSEHSQANINTLTRSEIQIQMGRGMANYTVLRNSDADAEIDTPNVAIRTNRRESSFRILVTADDHTEVLVRRGEVEITTPQGGTRVGEGQFITVQGSGDQAQYKIGEAPARDDWDQWNTDRDNMIRNAASRRRTNDYYVGAEDLDNHGTWSEVPDYGPVWRPTVADDWAPYRDGRWVYEPYWGWTWVSYDDWGWAPYHYGRWMMYDDAWVWWPGPVYGYPYYRPIWAPAYVSFFGVGGGFGFGFGYGWGTIGWLPLGPCDFFHPWWGRWGGRFGVTNITNINIYNRSGFAPLHGGTRFSNVNLALHDQHFRGGTTVSGNEFGRGRMHAQPMSHAQFQNARFTTGKLPVTPSRESFSASGRPAAASTTRNVSQNQHFFSARGNTAASRSVELGRPQVANSNRQNGGFTGSGREVARPGNTGSNVRSNIGSTVNSNNGFRRFGQTGQSTIAGSSNVRSSNTGSSNIGSRPARPENNSMSRPQTRGNSNFGSAPRPGTSGSAPARDNGNSGGGWQKFSPMPRSSSESIRPSTRSESIRPSESGGRPSLGRPTPDRPSMGRPSPSRPEVPLNQGRSYSSEGRGYGGYSRPPLNMRQPIVRQPSAAPRSYGGGPYGGNRGGYSGAGARPAPPSYGGGGRSAPSYGGGGRSAPSGGGGRSAPSGGGGHSAPSGGGSHGGGPSRGSSGHGR